MPDASGTTFPIFSIRRCGVLLCAGLLSVHLSADAHSADDVWEILSGAELQQASLSDRVSFWAKHFLNKPYSANGPLGEGALGQWDNDPLYRFDAFDCTTYIETVLALSRSNAQADFKHTLNALRYRHGLPVYEERNHIVTTAWTPNAVAKGFIDNFSSDRWGWATRSTTTNFNYGKWLETQLTERFNVPAERLSDYQYPERYPEIMITSDYLAIDELLADWSHFHDTVDTPQVINFVRPAWSLASDIGTDLLVSHQGFVFKDTETGHLELFHASASGSVTKVRLKDYLANLTDSHPVKGIQLMAVSDQFPN